MPPAYLEAGPHEVTTLPDSTLVGGYVKYPLTDASQDHKFRSMWGEMGRDVGSQATWCFYTALCVRF